MRTNVFVNEELLKESMKLANVKTKKEAINLALKEFVENRKKKNLKELKGKVFFADDYDYKKMR